MQTLPKFLFLHLASECNLTCSHCLFWRSDTKNHPDRLSVEALQVIIGEFAELSPQGNMVICGGEPMLEYSRYIRVCEAARRQRLRVFSATNGYPVHSPERAEDLLLHGPHEILVSLDSHDPGIHNAIRGRANAYDTAVRAIKLLVEARERLGCKDSRIHAMTLMTSHTAGHLRELYQLVLSDLSADKLKINGLQPSFGVHSGTRPEDEFFAKCSQLDSKALRTELSTIDAEFGLKLNPAWILQLCDYYEDLREQVNLGLGWERELRTREHICNCYERNLVVGLYGEVGHCYDFNDFHPIRYRVFGDLRKFWEGNELREPMSKCNRLCGIGHSNRRLSATLRASSP